MKNRREFLKVLGLGGVAFRATLPAMGQQLEGEALKPLRVGLITDVHQDLVPDATQRLATFVRTMNEAKADAVIQLGDFCIPKPENLAFLKTFQQFQGPQYHVLGNHDMDGGKSREDAVAFLGMPSRYYSFDLGGYHFVVLDANDRPEGDKTYYPSFLAEDQVKWLKEDLAKHSRPTFVFSHQSLALPKCIDNQEEVRAVLEAAKLSNGSRQIVACFHGHWHIDQYDVIHEIPYLHLNSASYFWMGNEYRREVLEPELAKKYPLIASTAPYTKPLFTQLVIDPKEGTFSLIASKSEWMGPTPKERNYPLDEKGEVRAASIHPEIGAYQGKWR